jgi:peptidoglycan/xylan/chitin deacetylase (PgdA/CDA1 family)
MIMVGCAALNKPFPSDFGVGVPVIMYHRVVADELKITGVGEQNDVSLYTRSASEFKKEMAFLADQGFTPILFDQFTDYLLSKDPKLLPRKPVIISFDDGSTDWFDIVFPILATHKFKATFFLITDDESRRKYLGDIEPMNWRQIQQMASYKTDTGLTLFNFESHTHSHMDLSAVLVEGVGNSLPSGQRLTGKTAIIREELNRSMKVIQEKTGRRPAFLALPYGAGAWDSAPDSQTFPFIKSIAREVGYIGIRTSRRDIPNNLTTDPYKIGAQLTMLSITTYEQFVQRLKTFELD